MLSTLSAAPHWRVTGLEGSQAESASGDSKLSRRNPENADAFRLHSFTAYCVDSATLAMAPSRTLRNVYESGAALVSGAASVKYWCQSPEAIIATEAFDCPPSEVTLRRASSSTFLCSALSETPALKIPL